MKDKLDIEELFKEKLSTFEGDVHPDIWSNIQQGMQANGIPGSGAAAAKTGLSGLMKTLLISGGLVAAGVTGVLIATNEQENETATADKTELTVENTQDPIVENTILADELTADEVVEPTLVEEGVVDNSASADHALIEEEQVSEMNILDQPTQTVIGESSDAGSVSPGENPTSVNNSGTETEATSTEGSNTSNSAGDTPEVVEEAMEAANLVAPEADPYVMKVESEAMTYHFSANASKHHAVKWIFGDGTFTYGEDVKHTYKQPGTYPVRVVLEGEKDVVLSVEVIEIESQSSVDKIPNIFTPDAIASNNYFFIETTGIESLFIRIYDEYGQLVFESNDVDFKWDGTDLSGNKLKKGAYTYELFAKGFDGKKIPRRGIVSIQ